MYTTTSEPVRENHLQRGDDRNNIGDHSACSFLRKPLPRRHPY